MTSAARPIDLAQKFASFCDRWSPRTAAAFNGGDAMAAKAEGEFLLAPAGEPDVEPRGRVERVGAGGPAAAERKEIWLSITSRL